MSNALENISMVHSMQKVISKHVQNNNYNTVSMALVNS